MPRKLTHGALATLAAVLLLPGCGESYGAGSKVVVRDSAGVQIVENGRVRELPPAFVISPTARLDLGGEKGSPEEELGAGAPFLNAARLSDGRFVVSDMSVMKMFDAEGRYLSTIGHVGDGPGEFRQLRAACVAAGDTIVAIAYGAPRVSVFDRAGEHVRTFNVKDGYVEGSGCFEDGSILIHSHARPNPESALPPDQASAIDRVSTARHVAPDGTVLGIVGDFPTESSSLFIEEIANAVPNGDRVYVGNGRLPEIHVYTRNGALVRIIRWDQTLIPVTDDLLKERVLGMLPKGSPSSQGEEMLARARSMPRPATVPAYFSLQVDAAGRIWVEDHPIGSPSPRPWTVFDSTGRALGRVVAPQLPGVRFVQIPSIGRDEALLAWRDEENGFAHLTFHALEPAGR